MEADTLINEWVKAQDVYEGVLSGEAPSWWSLDIDEWQAWERVHSALRKARARDLITPCRLYALVADELGWGRWVLQPARVRQRFSQLSWRFSMLLQGSVHASVGLSEATIKRLTQL